jgi:hypothetical protein
MNRFKFLIFAVVALGLFAWALKLAPALGADRSARAASVSLAGAPAAVALRLEARRSEVQAAALRLGGSSALTNPGPKAAKPEMPTLDRFNAVRAAATEGMSDAFKAGLVVVVSNEAGALVAQGPADGAAPPEGFDLAGVSISGGGGAVVTAYGVPHLFFALPLVVSDKNEVKAAGLAAIGAPVLPDGKALLQGLAAELNLSGLALLADGKVLMLEGDKALLGVAAKQVKPGPIVAVTQGALEQLGPLSFPMMSDLTQQLALRRPLVGTPYEVLATVSSAEALVALAGFQKFGVGALAGLLLLSVVVTALLKSGEEDGAAMVMPPPPLPAPPRAQAAPEFAPVHAAPEASPDDFDFPAPQPARASQAPARVAEAPPAPVEPASDPFADLGPALAPVPAPAPAARPPPPMNHSPFQPTSVVASRGAAPSPATTFEDDDGARTVAYPVLKPNAGAPRAGVDPFAMASASYAHEDPYFGSGEPNPDATRVAAVPAELIKAARQSDPPSERPGPSPRVSSPAKSSVASASGSLDEERHFQDIFREFVTIRERCGEPADGLTYDKFKTKLLKNKEQLVQKYNCKSVRFQVYVKDGKAALKATPVKE